MTRTEPLPRQTPTRTVGDHIRRADIADAALGVDPYVSLEWLAGTGVHLDDALTAWADSKLVEVPAGGAFDVVRMSRTPGWDAVRHLRAMGAHVGPILHTYRGVEAFVRVGAVAGWDLPGSRVLDSGEVVNLPHPSAVAPHTVQAHSWVVTPRDGLNLTDGADLYGAYAAALVTLGHPVDDEAA